MSTSTGSASGLDLLDWSISIDSCFNFLEEGLGQEFEAESYS